MSGVIWKFEIVLDDDYVWIGGEMGVWGVNVSVCSCGCLIRYLLDSHRLHVDSSSVDDSASRIYGGRTATF